MSAIPSPRRYYLLKRLGAVQFSDRPLDGVWRSKQEALPGTSLPSDFPSLSVLAEYGYTAVEDLDGATVDELRAFTSLTQREAEAVIAAASNL